jgi:hypothetical protein
VSRIGGSEFITKATGAFEMIRTGNGPTRLRNSFRSRRQRPRILLKNPFNDKRQYSPRRINALLARSAIETSYLEVGVSGGVTLERVVCARSTGVDPHPRFDTSRLPRHISFYEMGSDEFFDTMPSTEKYSVVFLDGLHTAEQTYRDVVNALSRLSPGGAILLDDTVPCDAISAIPDQARSLAQRRLSNLTGSPWHGDVWKVVVALANHRQTLALRTILGSGNPQTLVWRHSPEVDPVYLPDTLPEEIRAMKFENVFVEGNPPSYFNPCSEDEAIDEWTSTRHV